MRKTNSLSIESTVTNYIEPFPSYGIYSIEGDEEGLYYDRDFYKDSSTVKESYPDSLGGYSFELKEGTVLKDWQSGVGEDLKLESISIYREEDYLKWVPTYESGKYYVWDKEIYLSSNTSCHLSLEEKTTLLDVGDFKINEARVAIWMRNSDKIKVPWRTFEMRENAEGDRIQAFSLKDNTVELSENFKKKIGTDSFDSSFWERKGLGTSGFKYLFCDYFPISKNSFKLVAVEEQTGKQIEFIESKNIFKEKEKKHYFEIDRDIGLIKVGNKDYAPLIVKEDVSSIDTKIRIINIEDLNSYPDSGYVSFDGSDIYYESKGKGSLEGVIIPIDGVSRLSELKATERTFDLNNRYRYYLKYDAIPRFDYETEENGKRTCNKYVLDSSFLNLKASSNYYTNGIVQIDTMDRHVSSLVLEVQDGDLIGENYYGDIYYNFYEILKATALDSNLEGVGEIKVTFVIESGPGYISGGKKAISVTNPIGESFVGFFAPYSFESVRKRITKYEYNVNETVFSFEEVLFDIDPEEVQLYEVLKIDENEGTVGVKKAILEKGASYEDVNLDVTNKTYIKVGKLQKEDFDSLYEGGTVRIQNGVSSHYFDEDIEAIAEGNDHYIIFLKNNYNTNNISIFGASCYLLKKERSSSQEYGRLTWSGNSRNGLKRLVYKWNENVTHPLTKTTGAYYPLRPDKVDNKSITYNVGLREHKPFDQEESLGDYVAIAPGVTTIYAYCTDPYSGDTIVSNRIKLKISLPRYLNGVDFQETLPVPYGFRLKDEDDNVASAIGGKTFLTTNPEVANKLTLNIKMS